MLKKPNKKHIKFRMCPPVNKDKIDLLSVLKIVSYNIHFISNNPGCVAPLGMEDGTITDEQITASSRVDGNHSAVQARLNFKADGSKAGAWSALTNDRNQWLQVDLASYTRVTRIATQGRNGYNEWVTKYKLQYSDDEGKFQLYKEFGESVEKVCHLHLTSSVVLLV